MSATADLLIEIGTEELPPKALLRLSGAFTDAVCSGLQEAGLQFAEPLPYATPRRLALLLRDTTTLQEGRDSERRGPALTAAFDDDGNPTKATLGFARSCGVEVDALERLETDKGSWLVWRSHLPGQPTAELLPAIIATALERLPIPKRMRWGSGTATFVRPVHWTVVLLGDDLVDCELLGVRSGRTTRGHRFHAPEPLPIKTPAAYAAQLEEDGFVIADFAQRRERVRSQVLDCAARLGGSAIIDPDLLDEVTSMVEWPVALSGNFEERFLEVPQEALIDTMKSNQKYFHLVDESGRLLPHFITVSNIESRDPDAVRQGNERVVRPRLADADFFWNQDLRTPLAERLPQLNGIIFQQRLGSLHDKVMRLSRLVALTASQTGADSTQCERAALLCKCDLVSGMVGEFPELQGIMGRYYARHDGEDAAVADAIDQHYMPRNAGDGIAGGAVGRSLAIADRLDALCGIFGIGQPPTGDKDPFALRRAALGVLRTIIEGNLREVDLRKLIEHAISGHGKSIDADDDLGERILDFLYERLRSYYEERHIAFDTFQAVLAVSPSRPADFDARLHAVEAFRQRPEAESLAAANKRTGNILRKQAIEAPLPFDPAHLVDHAERTLAEALEAVERETAPLLAARDYATALSRMASLRAPVDDFFDNVMVMTDESVVRNNRLALLQRLRALFLQVADLSLLQTSDG